MGGGAGAGKGPKELGRVSKRGEEEGVFLCSQAPCLITITFPPPPPPHTPAYPIDEILAIFHLTSLNSMFTFVALFYIINLVSVFALVGQKGIGVQDCQVKNIMNRQSTGFIYSIFKVLSTFLVFQIRTLNAHFKNH